MIVNNLYATDRSLIHPDTGGTIVDEFTRRVYELGQDKADSYFLGWIKKDTLPSNCLCSSLTVEGEQGSRTFTWENITDDDNFPCGYISGDIEGANQFNTTISRRLQYINQLYPEYSCEMESIGTTWNFYLYDSTGEHLLGSRNSSGITIPIKTFARLCMGYTDASFTITFNDQSSSPAVDRHFTLTPDNLGNLMNDSDDYLEWVDEDDSEQSAHCKLRVALRGFYVSPGRRYHNRPQYEPFNAQWFVKTTCTLNNIQYDHYAYSQSPDTIYPYNDGSPYTGSDSGQYGRIFEYPKEQDLHNYVNKIIQFGVHGEFTETQLDSFISSQNLYIVSNNIFGYKDNISATWAQFVPLYKFTDIFKCLCLQYRTDIDVTSNPDDYLQGYIPGRTYATDVTPEDEFLAKWKTGDINDPAFKKSLRPWQYENFQENDFTEEDIPGPIPGGGDPGGDPDDDEEEDDAPNKQDWGNPMNPSNGFDIPYGFANYKAFNNAGIVNFAERLWDAPDDFWDALTITNKNNANWLDYFISLRAYPYWINSVGEEANIYVGAGGKFYLGDEGTNLYASNPQHITFFVLNFSIDKYYNNFLDFAPYTKAYVYLPFSGTWEVNPKYLYHTTLQILLKLDITDGSGVWQVIRSGVESAGSGYIILEKQCKIGVEIPLSGLNATTMSSNIVNATLGTYQRTGNEMGKIAGTATSGAALGGPIGATLGMAAGAVMTGLENSVDMANANREHISVNGGMTGLAAANCNVIPSITLVRPIAQNPDNFPHTIGHLVNKTETLSSLTGFTTCRNVDVSNVGQATEKEKAQLKKILENGFYA